MAGPEHPSQTDLLLAVSGELSDPLRSEVRRHITGCVECQAFLTEADEVTSRFGALVSREDGTPEVRLDASSFRAGLHRQTAAFSRVPSKQWVRWVAIVPLVVFLAFPSRFLVSVRASELLDRAVFEEQRVAAIHANVRIRVRPGAGVGTPSTAVSHRELLLTATLQSGRVQAIRSDRPHAQTDVETIFAALGMDWRAPLSADVFRSWRRHAPSSRDRIVERADATTIETEAVGGPIRRGVLLLDAQFQARQLDWYLEDGAQIEIAAVAASAEPRAEHTPSNLPVTRERRIAPQPAKGLEHAEIAARLVLHHLKADLGEDVQVRANGATILVSGVVDTTQRRRELSDALERVPSVRTALRAADSPDARGSAKPSRAIAQGATRPALLDALTPRDGVGANEAGELSNRLLAAAREVHARARVMQALKVRYPAQRLSALTSADRDSLVEMFENHARALNTVLATIRDDLSHLLLAPDGVDEFQTESTTAALRFAADRDGTSELVRRAAEAEQQLIELLADTDRAESTTKASDPSELMTALRRNLAAMEGLTQR